MKFLYENQKFYEREVFDETVVIIKKILNFLSKTLSQCERFTSQGQDWQTLGGQF